MKICVLGNAHAAPMIEGWRSVAAEYPEVEISFFAAPANLMRSLGGGDGKLGTENSELLTYLGQTSGGATSVDIDAFDALALVGLDVGAFGLSSTYRTHQPFAVRRDESRSQLISDDCLAATVDQYLRKTDGFRLLQLSRTAREIPVFLIPEPLPTAQVEAGERYGELWQQAALREHMLGMFDRGLATLVAETGVTLVTQPDETIVGGYTDPVHAAGSNPLDADGATTSDDAHPMNAAYGALVVRKLLGLLNQAPGSAPAPDVDEAPRQPALVRMLSRRHRNSSKRIRKHL